MTASCGQRYDETEKSGSQQNSVRGLCSQNPLEVFKSEFETSERAMKAALELKKKYPQIQVNVYDAKEHARTLVELTEKPAVSV